MLNKPRLWVRGKIQMCLQTILTILGGIIAFILVWYQAITINIGLATTSFYKWLPIVCTYNKRIRALNKLAGLGIDVASQDERVSGITHKAGILTKNDIGYREFVFIIRTEGLGSPDEIIYEQIEQLTGKFNTVTLQPTGKFNTVTLQPKVELITSLSVKVGKEITTIREIDPYDPTKIIRELKDLIKFKRDEIIAKSSCIGAFLLLLLLIVLAIIR